METNQEIFNRENNGSVCNFHYDYDVSEIKLVRSLGSPTFYSPKKDVEEQRVDELYLDNINADIINNRFIIDCENEKLYQILDINIKYDIEEYNVIEVSSIYWQTDEGVYRLSFHWGEVGKSQWTLDDPDYILGYANWNDFKFND